MSGELNQKFHKSFTDLGLSSIVAISEKVRELEQEGQTIIKFQRGDLNIDTPEYVKEALKHSVERGRTNYPKSGGEPNVKDAIINYHKESGLNLKRENIVVLHGGQEGLQLSFSLFREKRVLGFSPYWPCLTGNIFPYTEMKFDTFELNNDLTFDPELLENKMKNIDIFYHNSPHNPTGKVFSIDELKCIDELARKNNVLIISDEPYDKITFDNITTASMLELENPNTITIFSGSKSFAATGLRVGHAISLNNEIIKLLTRANYSQTAGVATPIQDMYAEALGNIVKRNEWFDYIRAELQQRRDILFEELQSVFPDLIKPQGAFYAFPDMTEFIPENVNDIDEFLLNLFLEKGVAIVPGGSFGKEGYFRISFSATSMAETKIGAQKICEAVSELKTGIAV